MQRAVSVVSVTFLVVVLVGCSSGSTQPSSPTVRGEGATTTTTAGSGSSGSSGTVASSVIIIRNGGNGFAFGAASVPAASTVTVKNLTAAQHTVTADTTGGGFDVTVDADATATFTAPSTRGVYGFHCNIHNFMKGMLTVT